MYMYTHIHTRESIERAGLVALESPFRLYMYMYMYMYTHVHTSESMALPSIPSKPVYHYGVMDERAVCVWQKSPMCTAKEPYVYGKRALCVWQKSPMCMAKEPY